MRSRTVREGSLGLFILLGALLFAIFGLWLRGLEFGKRKYTFEVQFTDANGLREGGIVRYRGFQVGRIVAIGAAEKGVEATVEISEPGVRIPKNSSFQANQSGLIGETTLDIVPPQTISPQIESLDPLDETCNAAGPIVCNNTNLSGETGISFGALLASSARFTELYTDPIFFQNLNSTAKNAGLAAAEIAALSKELALLSKSVRQEIKSFSTVANSISNAADRTTAQVGNTADKLSQSIDTFNATALELGDLAKNVNGLVSDNRNSIQTTLQSIGNTSERLNQVLANINPTLNKVNSKLDSIETEQIIKNLETLTANSAEASANLRDLSKSINDPTNIVVLQKTLDAARVTFENAQKITSDLDELTGNPTFRQNLLNLVNGLSNLVSSTQQLEQQVKLASTLESMTQVKQEKINNLQFLQPDTKFTINKQQAISDRKFSQKARELPPSEKRGVEK
jgi:phospholipid/cholesterol/gamma-HCH transport system substrate-binding protein